MIDEYGNSFEVSKNIVNPQNALVVPENFELRSVISFANSVYSEDFPASYALMYLAYRQGGSQDYQRNYTDINGNLVTRGPQVGAFQDSTSFLLGFVSQLSGAGPGLARTGGDLYAELWGHLPSAVRNDVSITGGAQYILKSKLNSRIKHTTINFQKSHSRTRSSNYSSSSPSEPANEVYGIGGLPGAGAALNTTPQSTTTPAGTSTSTNTSPETTNAQAGSQSSGQLGDSTTTTAQQPTDGTEPPATSTNTSTTETPTTPASTASTDFLVNVSGSQPVAGAPNYSNGVVGSTPASSSGITLTSDLLNEPSLTQQMLAQPVTTSPVRVLPPNAHEGQDQVTPPGGSEGSAMPVSGQDGGDSTSGANAGGGGGVDTLPASGGDDAVESQPLAGETTFVMGDQFGVTAGPGPALGATFAGTVGGRSLRRWLGRLILGRR